MNGRPKAPNIEKEVSEIIGYSARGLCLKHFQPDGTEQTHPMISDERGWRIIRRLRCLNCGTIEDYELLS